MTWLMRGSVLSRFSMFCGATFLPAAGRVRACVRAAARLPDAEAPVEDLLVGRRARRGLGVDAGVDLLEDARPRGVQARAAGLEVVGDRVEGARKGARRARPQPAEV